MRKFFPAFVLFFVATTVPYGQSSDMPPTKFTGTGVDGLEKIKPLCEYCLGKKPETIGHRGGGDEDYCPFPENTKLALKIFSKCGVSPYLEFDINSTRKPDKNSGEEIELVVFHGSKLKKFVALDDSGNEDTFKNISTYTPKKKKMLTVQDVKAADLKKLILKRNKMAKKMKTDKMLPESIEKQIADQRIPTLKEYLKEIKSLGISKPLRIDIKMIQDKEEMAKLFEIIDNFRHPNQDNASNDIEITLTTKWYRWNRWRRLPKESKKCLCELGLEKKYLVDKIRKKCIKYRKKNGSVAEFTLRALSDMNFTFAQDIR